MHSGMPHNRNNKRNSGMGQGGGNMPGPMPDYNSKKMTYIPQAPNMPIPAHSVGPNPVPKKNEFSSPTGGIMGLLPPQGIPSTSGHASPPKDISSADMTNDLKGMLGLNDPAIQKVTSISAVSGSTGTSQPLIMGSSSQGAPKPTTNSNPHQATSNHQFPSLSGNGAMTKGQSSKASHNDDDFPSLSSTIKK